MAHARQDLPATPGDSAEQQSWVPPGRPGRLLKKAATRADR